MVCGTHVLIGVTSFCISFVLHDSYVPGEDGQVDGLWNCLVELEGFCYIQFDPSNSELLHTLGCKCAKDSHDVGASDSDCLPAVDV
jgi:hypothetical protein